MVGMEEGLLPHANAMNASFAELEEERRLCYVGFTRAMEHLYLSYVSSRKMFGYSKRQVPSRFLYEIPPSLINRTVDDFSDYTGNDEIDDIDIEQDELNGDQTPLWVYRP